MDPSKLIVLMISALILLGVGAWSWVNFTQTPAHDPEVAHAYVQHFDRRCTAELQDEQLCADVIGHYHRSCFDDHLQPTPTDRIEEDGPVLYDRSAYMKCMRLGIDKVLSDRNS